MPGFPSQLIPLPKIVSVSGCLEVSCRGSPSSYLDMDYPEGPGDRFLQAPFPVFPSPAAPKPGFLGSKVTRAPGKPVSFRAPAPTVLCSEAGHLVPAHGPSSVLSGAHCPLTSFLYGSFPCCAFCTPAHTLFPESSVASLCSLSRPSSSP